jgi:hypothetical protein
MHRMGRQRAKVTEFRGLVASLQAATPILQDLWPLHGSIKRVASAVGEGSTAIRLIHGYLALAPTVHQAI